MSRSPRPSASAVQVARVQLTPEKEESDEIYSQLRATSREFRDGILALFFDDRTELANLTKVYGLF